ncbi:MAG: hypothetical protein Q9219_003372 [cf. Caloplaca sp. 3 TL-2023]
MQTGASMEARANRSSYAARVPEMSRTLCKKLGGPLLHSPVRPALSRAASSSRKLQKPGVAAKRPQPREARRTLERVLTEDKTSRRPAPALSRSATDSFLPSLRREPSDVALSSVPPNRPAFHTSNRYSQREVDLTAVSQAKEAKEKRKANVNQELQGAIAALKRPNPRMAVKEYVEAAERRAAGAKLRSMRHTSETRNPVRNPFAQGVQIMATPSINRRKDVFGSLPIKPPQATMVHDEVENIPTSSFTHVPASTMKNGTGHATRRDPDMIIQRSVPTIEQTPTRGPEKYGWLNVGKRPKSGTDSVELTPSSITEANCSKPSPDVPKTAGYLKAIHATPSRQKSARSLNGLPANFSGEGTPIKQLRSVSANVSRASCNIVSSPASEGERSIYKTLGWDDDVDELL